MLVDIANAAADSSLDLHISIFVTCQCEPEAVPHIPNSVVTTARPDVHQLLACTLSPTRAVNDVEDEGKGKGGGKDEGKENPTQVISPRQGGVGVCASGPESLTREAANAVASLAPVHARRVGGIALHTEVFSL